MSDPIPDNDNDNPGPAGRPIALITGASGALGTAVRERLLVDGWAVVAADREKTSGADIAFDVTRLDEWEDALAHVEERWGPVDGLVLAHGIVGAEAPVGEYPAEVWGQVMDVNLTACFLGLSTVLPRMAARGRGRVAAFASITGREPNPNQSAYSVSKAGVIALVKAASREYASHGVLVNAVAPGVIDTPMAGKLSDELRETILSKVPFGRFGRTEEVAAMVAFLLSDDVTYTTGQIFDVSGGRAAV